jgi:hypothetical protein
MLGRGRFPDAATKDSMAKSGQRRRSAFRDEFYANRAYAPASREADKKPRRAGNRRHTKAVPFWVAVGLLGIVFCIIAVGGSAGMIYLREIANFFGVYWAGD